jgi:hypothetical protein
VLVTPARKYAALLAALGALVLSGTALGAAAPPVPASAQASIRTTAGAEAYVPTRLVSGMHYRFRIWSFARATQTLAIRFADLRFAPGTHPLYYAVAPFTRPLAHCADGKQKTIEYDGNRVYWNGTDAWRCIAGPRGVVKVTARGPHLPDVAFARVVASAKRISGVRPLPGFRSPSGNISCFVIPGNPSVLHCGIAHATYAAALQHRCMRLASLDWHGFELAAAAKGAVTCSGGILYSPGTQRPSYVVLRYGRRWRQDGFACTSRRTGVSCTSRAGHGLFLSRQSWRVW